MVKDDESEKTTGSEPGVDDHTIKLPSLCEAPVRTKVTSRRMNKVALVELAVIV